MHVTAIENLFSAFCHFFLTFSLFRFRSSDVLLAQWDSSAEIFIILSTARHDHHDTFFISSHFHASLTCVLRLSKTFMVDFIFLPRTGL